MVRRVGFLGDLRRRILSDSYKVFTIAAGALSMALLPFTLASLIGRGARFFLVAGLMAWGGARMEATLHRYIDRLGWATVALVAIGAAIYQWRGAL
ncbi:MAG: hypothetical protein Q7U24_09375 [Sulfurimicrobium sp.]|nr:hypothetical protein [Sulfurimicrobium sp.]